MTLFCAGSSMAQKLEWELGGGLAGFDVPLYVGSSQSKQYLLPVPYAKLTSRYLEVDEMKVYEGSSLPHLVSGWISVLI